MSSNQRCIVHPRNQDLEKTRRGGSSRTSVKDEDLFQWLFCNICYTTAPPLQSTTRRLHSITRHFKFQLRQLHSSGYIFRARTQCLAQGTLEGMSMSPSTGTRCRGYVNVTPNRNRHTIQDWSASWSLNQVFTRLMIFLTPTRHSAWRLFFENDMKSSQG